MTVGNHFPKEVRLRDSQQFRRVFQHKRSVSDGLLIMYGVRNGLETSRLGLSVSRKVGNAVRRNRWKRCIRESFRLQAASLVMGLDIVVIPRRDAQPTLKTVSKSIRHLMGKLDRRIGM